jgi:superfamily II DNA or RNA helicase
MSGKIILRDYQADILERTQDSFRTLHKRPLIVAPCGSGKTAMFARMAETSQAKGNTVWFLVHRRELLDQTIDTFERFAIPRKTIHIGMVATVANRPERLPKPDFIVFDEGHHASAATWGKIISAYPDAFVVGLTATPCRLDGKPLGAVYDDLVVGITAQELIQQGYLAPYRYFAPAVTDLSALKRKGKDYDAQQAAELLSQRAIFGDVIRHYRDYADGVQAICYCTTIKHSQAMAQAFCDVGISAVHFDGNTPKKERTEIISRYRAGEIKILCNVDLISEGFDCPDCGCCILLRPTMSTALFIQQSMRALRPKPGKTAIILDHVNNYQRHGLPDDDRAWSLSDTVKPQNEYGEDGKLLVRQCPECFFTYETGPAVCPNCGYESVSTAQEIKNIEEIRLKEIKRRRIETAREKVTDETTLEQCRTLAEIQAWCKRNGKKPGYGWYIWTNRRRKTV